MRLCINYGSGINNTKLRPSVIGIMHGICCGDGTTGSPNPSHGTYLYLCGKKDAELLHYFGDAFHITDAPEIGSEGAKRVADLPRYFRRMPSLSEAATYLYGWLAGYFAADGRISEAGTPQICSAERTNLEYVRSICAILGIGCHDVTQSLQTVTYPDGSKKKFIGYAVTLFNSHLNEDFFLLSHHKKKYNQSRIARRKSIQSHEYWYVDSVEETEERKEVYCAQVPDYHCFTLAGNILTGNCGYVSTYDKIETDPAEPFCFLMDMSMLGVGVGFDTRGAGRIGIRSPKKQTRVYQVPDSREGWVESVRQLIYSYTILAGEGYVDFDYSQVRPAGSIINGFGGKASGPDILIELHDLIRDHLERKTNQTLSSVDIVDIMNYIGRCVVAGNVRRTAEIGFGDPDDFAYCSMKNPTVALSEEDKTKFFDVANKLYAQNRHKGEVADFKDTNIPLNRLCPALETWNALNHHRWASNNSIFAKVGQDYSMVGEQIAANGEPGFIWLDNMRDYGRMIDGRQPGIDGRVMGSNPCVEQSLESYELCNLCESFPANHNDANDYMRTLKFAYLYAKTVTLLPTHNRRTNQVTLRNRRIGLSQSGIIQAFAKFGRRQVLHDFCDSGYTEIRRWDDIYSEWLCVNRSIKVTSVKPSGTISLVAGATPGIHHPVASTYWRRIRISADSILVNILMNAGFEIEPAISDKERTVVAKFAITDERVRPVNDVSIWEQMQNVADYQSAWADNQVSCTVTFKREESEDIGRVLEAFEDKIKGISFMPAQDHGFTQPPYEECTPEEVAAYNGELKETDYSTYVIEAVGSKFCDGDTCTIIGK
jgi:adenosylcobalamin-dependent ribonucleoside-triphosphate reductase